MGLLFRAALAVRYKSQASLAKTPIKNESGKKRTTNMRKHVKSDENVEFSFRFKKLYTGEKTPVTTIARMMTDKNGHRSHPNKKQDTIKTARKNHRIISREP
jgi:hypothetical protein